MVWYEQINTGDKMNRINSLDWLTEQLRAGIVELERELFQQREEIKYLIGRITELEKVPAEAEYYVTELEREIEAVINALKATRNERDEARAEVRRLQHLLDPR